MNVSAQQETNTELFFLILKLGHKIERL